MATITDFEIVRTKQTEPIVFYVKDGSTDELTDVIASSTWSLIDIASDTAVASGTFTGTGGSAITRLSAGVYQYMFNAKTYTGEYLFSTRCVLANETQGINTFVKSVSARQFAYAAQLRIQVDKSRKSISDDIQNMDRANYEPPTRLFYGYTDAHMIFYLERGAQIVNVVPPYTSFSVDTFPFSTSGTILIDAATVAALESQGIFAIDTDYNYSLGGNSLVIDHFSKLNTALTSLMGRFDQNLVRFKQQFRSKGLVMFQFSPGGVRSSRTLNAMPSGFWSRMLSSAFI